LEEGVEVDVDVIAAPKPKKKMTKEERRATVLEGRTGIERKWAMRNPTGTTNREKLKNKPFQLTKYSAKIQKKKNLAFNEQQKKQSKHIKGLKKLSKKRLRSMRK